jgi:hypothetical protein
MTAERAAYRYKSAQNIKCVPTTAVAEAVITPARHATPCSSAVLAAHSLPWRGVQMTIVVSPWQQSLLAPAQAPRHCSSAPPLFLICIEARSGSSAACLADSCSAPDMFGGRHSKSQHCQYARQSRWRSRLASHRVWWRVFFNLVRRALPSSFCMIAGQPGIVCNVDGLSWICLCWWCHGQCGKCVSSI